VCTTGASQLAFCNFGQRAFVVDENNQTVQIIDYGDLANPSPIEDGSGGFLSILADDMLPELTLAGVTDITTLVPSDVDIFNVIGPDDTTYCCSTMVAVAWVDTFSLNNSGWVTLHDIDGGLLPTDAIREVGPTPRSLAFSQDGNWLVVACSGEGEHETTDPMAEIVCIKVTGYTQGTAEAVVDHVFTFADGTHIVGGALSITGNESRTSASVYDGTDDLSHMLEPSHVAITPDSKRAFVNCQVNNTLVEVNLENVTSGSDVIHGAYGFGLRDMASGNGFDGKYDGEALVEKPPTGAIQGWYQPGDMVIDTTETGKIYLLTANEGLPSKDAFGVEEVDILFGGDYDGLEIDSEYGGAGNSFVYGSRSFSILDITTLGLPIPLYDSKSLIEETLALLMPDYANSLKSTYDSGDQASVSRGPEPAGIAFGTLNDKKIIIVSLEEMGGSMIFDLLNWDTPSELDASYQAYATHRDFQNPNMDICVFNHLGAKDVLFLPKSITDNTSVSGIVEGYDAIMVSNDETGSLTLFRLDSNLDIPGCMDSCACNYNENATLNDGSCDFDSCVTEGCTYPDADNFDPEATLDIGTCVFTNDCLADLDGSGTVTTSDLLIFLSAFGIICP
jgi:DNA-binding beta-propeller fold protein YncE